MHTYINAFVIINPYMYTCFEIPELFNVTTTSIDCDRVHAHGYYMYMIFL